MAKSLIYTGIDIGTDSIITVIGEVTEDGELDIIGTGEEPSSGVRRGAIVNIDAAAEAVSRSVESAEIMAGLEAGKVIVGIGGEHITGINSKGVIGVNTKNREITDSEIMRVLDSAKSVRLGAEREIIHVISQEYKIDEQDGIKDPRGMSGTRLEAEVHIITGSLTNIENTLKVIKKSALTLGDVVVIPLAAAEAVLGTQEKDLGVVLIDIGRATTSVAVFIEGALWYTAVLPIGGEHVTNDIAMGMRIHPTAAETLKREYGCAYEALVDESEIIEVPAALDKPPRTMPRKSLAQIIEPRMEEIFRFVEGELNKAGCRDILMAGAVLTGGGVLLEGTAEIAEAVFGNMSVTIGIPKDFGGMVDKASNPKYAAAVGLIKGSAKEDGVLGVDIRSHKRVSSSPMLSAIADWFKSFIN